MYQLSTQIARPVLLQRALCYILGERCTTRSLAIPLHIVCNCTPSYTAACPLVVLRIHRSTDVPYTQMRVQAHMLCMGSTAVGHFQTSQPVVMRTTTVHFVPERSAWVCIAALLKLLRHNPVISCCYVEIRAPSSRAAKTAI